MQISLEAQETLARLKHMYDQEMAIPRLATSASEVPQSYEAITSEWLTGALCSAVPGAQVVDFTLGQPDPGTSCRRAIAVTYNDAGLKARLPQELFCKAGFGFDNRIALGICGASAAEIAFMRYVRPHLAIEATEGVFGLMNEALNSIVVLKDISHRVEAFCDHRTSMTLDRARDQVRLLATLHAAGCANPKLRAVHSEFKSWYDYFHSTKLYGVDVGAMAGFNAAADLIPARTYRRSSEVWAATEEAVSRSHRRPHTITHGDVHLKNWYITDAGRMGLSDWQGTSHGHWGRDLAYAMATALTVEDRRAWEKQLITEYLDLLASLGGDALPFDEAWQTYREQMLPALAWWTVTYAQPEGLPAMQPIATSIEFVTRLGTAVDDLQSLDA